jgi:hypothetical protein
VLKPDTYKLANEQGEVLTNAWNTNNYVPSTLRKKFQVISCISDAPVGCIYDKFVNKVKGDSTFSLKNKSPSGDTTGGTPLNGHVSRKNLYSKNAKHVPTRGFGQKDAGRE